MSRSETSLGRIAEARRLVCFCPFFGKDFDIINTVAIVNNVDSVNNSLAL